MTQPTPVRNQTPAHLGRTLPATAWAATLCPVEDLLVMIAECSLSGSFYESQQKLAERAGISVSGCPRSY